MTRIIPFTVTFALALTEMALVTMVAGSGMDGDSNTSPKPCCFPKQFTATGTDIERRQWGTVTYDFVNRRKFVSHLDDDDIFFYYTDMAAGLTYEHRAGICKIYTTPGIMRTHLTFPCIPDDAVLLTQGGSLGSTTWKVHSNMMSGFITVDQDKCYPIAYTLTDTASGFGYNVFLTDIKEEIDSEVFNQDLTHCKHV